MLGQRALRAVGVGLARTMVAYVLAVPLAGAAVAAEDGLLERMREEVRDDGAGPEHPGEPDKPGKPDKPDGPPHGHALGHGHGHGQGHGDGHIVVESDLGQAIGMVILEGVATVLSSPFTVPRAAMRDHGWRRGLFTRYPYSDGPGYLSAPGNLNGDARVGGYRETACTAALAYAKDDGVETFRGDFQLRTAARAGLRVTYTNLVEDLGGGSADSLAMGDATALVRFAQHERAQMRFGIGYLSMLDENADGAIFVYEGDFFPREPMIVSAGVDVGGLGDAPYSRWHLGVGVALRNVEFSLGYSALRVGSERSGGPTLGSRVWF